MDTWIASDDTPETVNIRDDGAEAKVAVLDKDGIETEPAVPTRKPWPAGTKVICKAWQSGEDVQNFALWAQLEHDWRVNEQGAEAAATMLMFDTGIAIMAVMLVGLTGKMFIDKTTGKPLDVAGTPLERMATVRRLPQAVINYVVTEITRRSADSPLG